MKKARISPHCPYRPNLEIMDSPSYEATAEINLLDFPILIEMGFSEKLREAMDLDLQITHEMPYKSLWGRHSWLKVSFTPNSENSKVVGANILVIDITEDKKITGSYRSKDDFNEDPQNLEVSLSIGVAFYPKDGDDIFQLMSKADQALYRVKRSGKSDYNI